MAYGVDIALAHQDAVVGADQDRAERMMAVRGGLARDFVGGAKVGEHLIAGHGLSLPNVVDAADWTVPFGRS